MFTIGLAIPKAPAAILWASGLILILGPPNVGGHYLIRERHTHRVEIDMPRHCVDITDLHGAY